LILANWPFTLFVIMPTNLKILAINEKSADAETTKLIMYWGRLHSVRTGLGIAAVVVFIFALN
jgi:hypothetical protein